MQQGVGLTGQERRGEALCKISSISAPVRLSEGMREPPAQVREVDACSVGALLTAAWVQSSVVQRMHPGRWFCADRPGHRLQLCR